MYNILKSSIFGNLVLPSLAVILTIVVKLFAKNDKTNDIVTRDDFSVGIDLSATALILLITKTIDIGVKTLDSYDLLNKQVIKDNFIKLITNFFVIIIILVFIFIFSYYIRQFGWEIKSKDKNGQPEKKLRIIRGIIIPDLIGFGILIIVALLSGGQ